MNKLFTLFLLLPILLTGCRRSSQHVWEDTKTASRYMSRGIRSIGGKQGDSRQVQNRADFICQNDYDDEYTPFYDVPARSQPTVGEREVPLARRSPGEEGSRIPGIESFVSPSSRNNTAHIFQPIHFAYNSSLIKGRDNLVAVRRISEYLCAHSNVYIFVEGHCDERGPEAYNLALGSRRSNSIRSLLIKEGVNPDQIFTISYGKERPVSPEHNEDAWSGNRRGEFKIYQHHGIS